MKWYLNFIQIHKQKSFFCSKHAQKVNWKSNLHWNRKTFPASPLFPFFFSVSEGEEENLVEYFIGLQPAKSSPSLVLELVKRGDTIKPDEPIFEQLKEWHVENRMGILVRELSVNCLIYYRVYLAVYDILFSVFVQGLGQWCPIRWIERLSTTTKLDEICSRLDCHSLFEWLSIFVIWLAIFRKRARKGLHLLWFCCTFVHLLFSCLLLLFITFFSSFSFANFVIWLVVFIAVAVDVVFSWVSNVNMQFN